MFPDCPSQTLASRKTKFRLCRNLRHQVCSKWKLELFSFCLAEPQTMIACSQRFLPNPWIKEVEWFFLPVVCMTYRSIHKLEISWWKQTKCSKFAIVPMEIKKHFYWPSRVVLYDISLNAPYFWCLYLFFFSAKLTIQVISSQITTMISYNYTILALITTYRIQHRIHKYYEFLSDILCFLGIRKLNVNMIHLPRIL